MNTTLTPGVRKLPSALDIAILQTIQNSTLKTQNFTPATAALSAGALIAINNGSYSLRERFANDTNTDWYTRGDSQILNGQAVLSEDSPYLSHLSQTFVIPQGAKALQFTLVNTDLHSSNSSLAPGDAFEVALLNHTTNTSVLAPLTGLSQTDALLNIQSNGQTYLSNAITLTGATNTPRTVQIDVSTLTPGTVVTLYFDLLGFGAKDSTVTLDDVQLLAELSQAPVAQNDSATTNQNTAVTVDVLGNDRDPDGTLNPSTLIILQAPQHGQVSLNPNGTVTYQPTNGYTGSDQFTYAIQDNSGVYSNPAIVSLSILNAIPSIDQIDIDSNLSEGTPAQFSAQATLAGNASLTYTWDFGDGSTPTQGQTIQHTYQNNGTYTVTLTVNSGSNTPTATQQRTLTVNNLAPTVNAGLDRTANEGQTVTFGGTYTDPGLLDTHTLTWNFGDGSAPITGTLTPTRIYADNGIYTVTLTVTDNDGAATTDSLIVTVKNVAPTITNLSGPVTLNEGQSATATDPGSLDTLTYSWNFGAGTTPITGQSVTYTFKDNGTYPVVLTVTDKDGASTTQTLNVQVANVAPTVDAGLDKTSNEGQTVTFGGTYTDPGILDTQTISWNFGDGSAPITGTLSPTYIYKGNGTYTVNLTVTDKDGGSTTDTLVVTVNNVAPTITNLTGPVTLNEGQSATFSATATDPGVIDTLTYVWTFSDGTAPLTGQSVTHTFVDNGTYPVLLTVTDKDGAATSQTLNVKVANVAPTVDAGLDKTSNEGQTVTFGGTYTDPGILDTQTITWNFGDGSNATTGTLTPTHIYKDNGTYTVSLTVTDKDGGSTTDTLVVTVNNVAPTIATLTGPVTLNEGQSATYSATAIDPGANDTLTYSWNFGDGTPSVTGSSVTHTFADNGSYSILLTVTDKDGAATTQTLNVQVANVAPIPTGVTISSTLREGQNATFSATATDPGNDTLTYTWTFGDSTTPLTGQSVQYTYQGSGSYTISLTVTDKDGGTTTRTFPVSVANLPPILSGLTVPNTLTEGQIGTYSATATDPGNDTLTYTWTFGDSTPSVSGQTIARAYQDDGTYTATLLITDKDGATTTHTFAVNVSNAAPSADIGADLTTPVGTPVTFQSAIADPGLADTHTYLWTFGDGAIATDSATPTHTYTQAGTYTVTLTITDQDGAVATDTLIATVQSLALPALTVTDIALTESDTGTTTATFTVTLSAASTQSVTVAYFTTNGTTSAGQDYTPTSGTLTFAPGQTTQTVQIQLLGDRLTEGNETFFLNLSNATNAAIADSQGQATLLDNESVTNPGTNTFAIRTEGTFTMNGSGDLDGEPLNPNDDARIYAAKGYTLNGNPTLPVQRDAAGNILKDSSGKPILVANAVVVSPGYTTANGPTNKYAGLNPPTSIPLQPIVIPTYSALKTKTLNSIVPTGTAEVVFNVSCTPLNTLNDWNTKFPAPGTATQPKVVRVINGGLTIPSGVALSNTIIIVENGDINFNGSGHTANNVVLIANNGNINLNTVNATNLRVFATGAVNMNGAAKFNGIYNLIATAASNGHVTFNGSTKSFTGTDQLRVFSGGNITFNGSSSTRGSFIAAGTFTFNGSSTLYGSIATKGNITFNGSATVFGVPITQTLANLAPTNLTLSTSTLAENTSANTVVGTFITTDQNTSDIHTYQLVAGTGSTDNTAFSIVGDRLILNASANYETKPSYSIRVRTTDPAGGTFEKVFTVAITDANEAPTALTLSANTIVENNTPGVIVGNLLATDPDLGDTKTFQLVTGAGAIDNA